MKSTILVLLATVAVAGVLGAPDLTALGHAPGNAAATITATLPGSTATLLADADETAHQASRRASRQSNDDEEDCDDDDEGGCRRPRPAATPSAPITPPANGLFSPGATPQVRTN
ncbi:MAG: hypothetical protein C0457_21230 [Polymorphum sp.]|nr:hypothetical protein [Polymorphum sp.]